MKNVSKKTLGECARIIPGVLEQKKSGCDVVIFNTVLPNQLTQAGLVGEYGTVQRVSESHVEFLQTGDVLIKRLNPDCAVVFTGDGQQVLPSANVFAIRPYPEKLTPFYLAFILESTKALSRISQRSGIGTAVSAVTGSQIENCEIPVPPLEQQHKIGELWRLAQKRTILLQKMISENNLLLKSIGEKLYQ